MALLGASGTAARLVHPHEGCELVGVDQQLIAHLVKHVVLLDSRFLGRTFGLNEIDHQPHALG